jgi:hypothetical protein
VILTLSPVELLKITPESRTFQNIIYEPHVWGGRGSFSVSFLKNSLTGIFIISQCNINNSIVSSYRVSQINWPVWRKTFTAVTSSDRSPLLPNQFYLQSRLASFNILYIKIIVIYTICGIKAILQDSSVKIADDEGVSPSSSVITRVSCNML